MLAFAAVISMVLPLSNVCAVTVADDQPDSNWPAACPEAASSTPLCRNEVMLPLLPSMVKTSPEPVSKVTLLAAEALGMPVTRPPATRAVTAATSPASSAPPRRSDLVLAGVSDCMGYLNLKRRGRGTRALPQATESVHGSAPMLLP